MNARIPIVVATVAMAAFLAPQSAHAGGEDGGKSGSVSRAKKGAAKTREVAPAKGKKDALPPPFLQLPEQKAAREEVEQIGLPTAIKEKMLKGQPLRLEEIEELGKNKLSAPLILRYLRSEGGGYQLLTKDIDRLRAAGIADDALDYLLSAAARRLLYSSYLYSSPYLYYRDYYHHDSFHHELHHSGVGHSGDHQ